MNSLIVLLAFAPQKAATPSFRTIEPERLVIATPEQVVSAVTSCIRSLRPSGPSADRVMAQGWRPNESLRFQFSKDGNPSLLAISGQRDEWCVVRARLQDENARSGLIKRLDHLLAARGNRMPFPSTKVYWRGKKALVGLETVDDVLRQPNVYQLSVAYMPKGSR